MEKLSLANPFDENQKNKILAFEQNNNIKVRISDKLNIISQNITKSDYLKTQQQANEIIIYLLLENEEKIIDYCIIRGEKDRKIAKISLAELPKRTKKKIINQAIEYTFNNLKIEEIFLIVSPNDKNVLLYLQEHEFENLGEENGSIIYLIENFTKNQSQRMIA